MKPRDPLSIEQTLCDVLDALSIERAAKVTGRSVHYLRKLSDPQAREILTCRDAISLDLDHEALFGNRPIADAMRLIADARRPKDMATHAMLGGATIEAVRESSEAHAALIAALAPDASDAVRNTALREVVQAVNAKKRIIPILRAMMRRQPQAP